MFFAPREKRDARVKIHRKDYETISKLSSPHFFLIFCKYTFYIPDIRIKNSRVKDALTRLFTAVSRSSYRSDGFVTDTETRKLRQLGVIVLCPIGRAVIDVYAVGGSGKQL